MKIRLDKLDILCSEYIRRRAIFRTGGCERCLTPKFDIQKEDGSVYPDWKQLQASHFIGRSNRAVRYDSSNLVGICAGCHIYLTGHPLEHVEFFKGLLGEEEFDLLNARTRVFARDIDESAIAIYYKQKIEVLKGDK